MYESDRVTSSYERWMIEQRRFLEFLVVWVDLRSGLRRRSARLGQAQPLALQRRVAFLPKRAESRGKPKAGLGIPM
jgi:hypothetical protein